MRVFLLGAGASKSYSASPTNVRMPIARDFFETFDQLAISADPWVLQEGLIGYLAKKGVDPFRYLRSGIDIENLHSEVADDLTEAFHSSDETEWIFPWKAYHELLFLFASVLNEIQNGPVSNSHIRLAQCLQPTDIVLTFNWDTLMDRALEAATIWSVDSGYDLRPRMVYDCGWRDPRRVIEGARTTPLLLKLHGSTNWLTSHSTAAERRFQLTHTLDPATVHVFRHADSPYACFAGRFMPGYVPFSYGYYPPNLTSIPARTAPPGHVLVRSRFKGLRPEGATPSDGLASMPLIIPPTRRKSYELFGGLFANLWQSAEDALALADEIVVIGYSFPRTDTRSRELFVKAFMRRTTMPFITIIDPSPYRAAELFQSELGIHLDHMRVIPDYFSESFDLPSSFQTH